MEKSLQIEIIDSEQGFAALAESWQSILENSDEDNIHLTYHWLALWGKYFAGDYQYHIIIVKKSGRIVGIAPLARKKRLLAGWIPYQMITFMGHGTSDWSDFIIFESREQVLAAIFATLQKQNWGEILLRNIPENSANLPIIEKILAGKSCRITRHTPCYYVDLQSGGYQEFFSGTSKNYIQQDLRRLSNHLKKLNWNVNQVRAGKLSQQIPVLQHLHGCSQQRKKRKTAFADPAYVAFLQELFAEWGAQDKIRLYYLNIENKPAAFILALLYKRIFYYWQIGFDSAFEKLSPSKILLREVIKSCFGEGLTEFNLMRGDTEYKKKWTSQLRWNYQIRVLNGKGLVGQINRLRQI